MSDVWAELAQLHAVRPALALDRRADIALEGPELLSTAYDVALVAALHPSLVNRYAKRLLVHPMTRPLVITQSATAVALDAAREAGLSVLVAPERGPVTGTLIDRDGRSHAIDAAPEPRNDVTAKPGRAPWGQLALTLALLNDPTPRSQTKLAHETDLTQARVSQSFKQLSDIIARRHDGWTVRRPDLASNWLVKNYPRPKTSATWLTLDAPVTATTAIAEVLSDAGVEYAVTGQVAADRYAPWARPDRTTIWAERLVDLTAARCTPVAAADATVTIVVPDDPQALPGAVEREGLRLADPWRVWVTLVQDGDEAAANHLRARLLEGAEVPK
ncbi:hypothetical protein [Cellulomonas sp. P5_C5]